MGPTAWASVKEVLFSETAAGSSRRGTSSGITAQRTGSASAAPTPSAKVNASRRAGVVRSARVAAASAAATAACQHWVATIMRRRSRTSASAPPGSASRKVGSD